MLNPIVRFLGSLRRLLTRRPGGERRGSELLQPCFSVRPRAQLKVEKAEFGRWERAENRFRRERRRVWWLAQQGIEAGPSPVLGGVVGR
jgi:hypothetical protein